MSGGARRPWRHVGSLRPGAQLTGACGPSGSPRPSPGAWRLGRWMALYRAPSHPARCGLGPGLRPARAATARQEDPFPQSHGPPPAASRPLSPPHPRLPSRSLAAGLPKHPLGLASGPVARFPSGGGGGGGSGGPGMGRGPLPPRGKTLCPAAIDVLRGPREGGSCTTGRVARCRGHADRLCRPHSPGRRGGCASTSYRTSRSPWTTSGTAR